MAAVFTEYSDNTLSDSGLLELKFRAFSKSLDKPLHVVKTTQRYENSRYGPSRGYHPMTQPDIVRVQIGGVAQ